MNENDQLRQIREQFISMVNSESSPSNIISWLLSTLSDSSLLGISRLMDVKELLYNDLLKIKSQNKEYLKLIKELLRGL